MPWKSTVTQILHSGEKRSIWDLKHVKDVLNILDEGKEPPPGNIFIYHHMNFYVKINLRRKARLVANGSTSQPPTCLT